MNKIMYTLIITGLVLSCNSKSNTEKDQSLRDSTVDQTPLVDTTSKPGTSVTKKLIFNGYEEGDYPHLKFKDVETGEEYDFGHPSENVLGTSSVVLVDSGTSFGYKQNGNLLGSAFTVTMEKKMVDTHDANGQPVKAEAWRITNMVQ